MGKKLKNKQKGDVKVAQKGVVDTISELGAGISPIVIGLLLINSVVALPIIGAGNIWLGWGVAVAGGFKLYQKFIK